MLQLLRFVCQVFPLSFYFYLCHASRKSGKQNKKDLYGSFSKADLFCLEAVCKSPALLIKRAAPAMHAFFEDLLESVWCKMNVESGLEWSGCWFGLFYILNSRDTLILLFEIFVCDGFLASEGQIHTCKCGTCLSVWLACRNTPSVGKSKSLSRGKN